jgi:predicted transcriptional regulator
MTDILLNMLGAATAAILLGTFHAVWLEWKREKLAAAYDERVTALTRKHEPQRFVGDLLKAEISEKQRNVVPRLESESELALLPQADAQTPAAPIRRSVTPDYLICLEDGKQFKSLRRHLGALGLTPEQYRKKWKLPSDYPMVAPNYPAQRSALAKNMGLGQKRKRVCGSARH